MPFHYHGDGKRPVTTMQWIAAVSNSERVDEGNKLCPIKEHYLSNLFSLSIALQWVPDSIFITTYFEVIKITQGPGQSIIITTNNPRGAGTLLEGVSSTPKK